MIHSQTRDHLPNTVLLYAHIGSDFGIWSAICHSWGRSIFHSNQCWGGSDFPSKQDMDASTESITSANCSARALPPGSSGLPKKFWATRNLLKEVTSLHSIPCTHLPWLYMTLLIESTALSQKRAPSELEFSFPHFLVIFVARPFWSDPDLPMSASCVPFNTQLNPCNKRKVTKTILPPHLNYQ